MATEVFDAEGRWNDEFLRSPLMADFHDRLTAIFNEFDGDTRHLSHALMVEVMIAETRTIALSRRAGRPPNSIARPDA